ncbi:MAG TPA: hypothetical protein PKA37_04450 [Planctomycetota bacterium]|jgi:hypothetical protein|nr:hypothetical protein [Planctomycetota bacterium]
MHVRTYYIKNKTGVPTTGLRIHYVPTRTNIPTTVQKTVNPSGEINVVTNVPGLLELEWPLMGPLLPDKTIHIEIPFQGERINGVRLEWIPNVGQEPTPEEVVTRLRAQFRHRRELIRAQSDPIRGYSEFFCDMDFESMPLLQSDWTIGDSSSHELRKNSIISVEPVLRQRVMIKAAAPRNYALKGLPGAPQEHVLAIADFFLSLIDNARILRCLTGEACRNQRIGYAFDCFATGRLRLHGTTPSHGQPNGANIFCFAELAFLCIEMGIESDRFYGLLRGWLRCQELFLYAYAGSQGAPASFDSYSRSPMCPVAAVPDWLILHVRKRFDAIKSLEELEDESVRLARVAFSVTDSELQIAQNTAHHQQGISGGTHTALA